MDTDFQFLPFPVSQLSTLNCFLPLPPLRRTLEIMLAGVEAACRVVKLYATSSVRVKPFYAALTPAEIKIVEGTVI